MMPIDRREEIFNRFSNWFDYELTAADKAELEEDVKGGWNPFEFLTGKGDELRKRLAFITEVLGPPLPPDDQPHDQSAELQVQASMLVLYLFEHVATDEHYERLDCKNLATVAKLLRLDDTGRRKLFSFMQSNPRVSKRGALYLKWMDESPHFFEPFWMLAKRHMQRWA